MDEYVLNASFCQHFSKRPVGSTKFYTDHLSAKATVLHQLLMFNSAYYSVHEQKRYDAFVERVIVNIVITHRVKKALARSPIKGTLFDVDVFRTPFDPTQRGPSPAEGSPG